MQHVPAVGPVSRSEIHSGYFLGMTRAAVYGRQSRNKTKSIGEQLDLGHALIRAEHWKHAGDYQDGRSASRFSTKPRGGWKEVVLAVQSGAFDVLVLWESSRGDRTPESWFAFLSSCREVGIRIHVITHDRTYDLRNAREWKTLAEDGVNNAYESELLSIRTKRGHAGAAAEGKPAGGRTPYGYRRTYDTETGKPVGQFPHVVESEIVKEIVKRVAKGDTVLGIVDDLNRRQIKSPGSGQWDREAVRRIARNRAYVGLRVHKGVEHKGTWEAIVDESVFYAAQRVLSTPGRKVTRPGRQKHLLSYLGTCGACDGPLTFRTAHYRCRLKGCVSIPQDVADHTIAAFVIERLTKPDALDVFIVNDDGAAEKARGTAERLRNRLDQFRRSAARDETSPESLAVIEAELKPLIAQAEMESKQVAIPLVLREMLKDGPALVETRWNAASVVAQRIVVKTLCEVKVGRGKPGRTNRSDYTRFGPSRWHGDTRTWAELWAS